MFVQGLQIPRRILTVINTSKVLSASAGQRNGVQRSFYCDPDRRSATVQTALASEPTLASGSKTVQNEQVKLLFSAINHALTDFLPTKSNSKAVRTINAENFAQQDQDRLWSGGRHRRVDGSDGGQYRRTSLCAGL